MFDREIACSMHIAHWNAIRIRLSHRFGEQFGSTGCNCLDWTVYQFWRGQHSIWPSCPSLTRYMNVTTTDSNHLDRSSGYNSNGDWNGNDVKSQKWVFSRLYDTLRNGNLFCFRSLFQSTNSFQFQIFHTAIRIRISTIFCIRLFVFFCRCHAIANRLIITVIQSTSGAIHMD